MKTRRFNYDYYTVTLPSDLVQEESDWLDQMCSVAINSEAEYWDLGELCKRLGVTLEGTVSR